MLISCLPHLLDLEGITHHNMQLLQKDSHKWAIHCQHTKILMASCIPSSYFYRIFFEKFHLIFSRFSEHPSNNATRIWPHHDFPEKIQPRQFGALVADCRGGDAVGNASARIFQDGEE